MTNDAKLPRNLAFGHGRKFALYLVTNNLTCQEGANLLGISLTECFDVYLGIKPVTELMEKNFLYNTGQQLSQLRFNQSRNLEKELTKKRFLSIREKFKNAAKPIKVRKSLLDNYWNKQQIVENNIQEYSCLFLGAYVKMWRWSEGFTQYSVPAMFEEVGGTGKYITRDWFKTIEQNDKIDKQGNILFYRKFGKTLEQLVSPFIQFVDVCGIPLNKLQDIETLEEFFLHLDNL